MMSMKDIPEPTCPPPVTLRFHDRGTDTIAPRIRCIGSSPRR